MRATALILLVAAASVWRPSPVTAQACAGATMWASGTTTSTTACQPVLDDWPSGCNSANVMQESTGASALACHPRPPALAH
jgi:hypothetical protein